MRREFERYRLSKYRPLIACLQIAGAVGQLAGGKYPGLGILASGGLSAMMLIAIAVRLQIGDRLLQCIPAAIYMVGNAYLVFLATT